jgi:DNA-binding NarL/FixJ family response regulator
MARAIRTVLDGSVWAPRHILAILVERASATGKWPPSTSDKQITVREKEVLELLVTGRSNKEIAFPLGIEERTVKAHVSHLLRKLGVSNRIMLSTQAVNHGLVSEE